MEHMMIDIETLATDPGAVILSLAAVPFNLDGKRTEGKLWNISIESCLAAGLFIDGDTLEWWLSQKPEILKKQVRDPVPLKHALARFAQYMEAERSSCLWSHGATFDIPILGQAHLLTGMPVPWSYKGNRDTRTLFWLARLKGWDPQYSEMPSDKHDPRADAHRQVTWVIEAMKVIEKGGPLG